MEEARFLEKNPGKTPRAVPLTALSAAEIWQRFSEPGIGGYGAVGSTDYKTAGKRPSASSPSPRDLPAPQNGVARQAGEGVGAIRTQNTKHQRSSKLQVPSSKHGPRFGAWFLVFRF